MTNKRDKLIEFMIENIVFIIEMNTDTSRFILDDVVSYIRERFEEILSDKLILDRKQVEDMIEKYKKVKKHHDMDKPNIHHIIINMIEEYLQSLLSI